MVVVTATVLLGALALAQLTRNEVVPGAPSSAGLLRAAAIASLLAALTIAIDAITVPFSAGINVRFPKSLLFYPVMAMVVEVLFHLLPLALLSAPFGRRFRGGGVRAKRRSLWACVVLVALVEPIFQISLAGDAPSWLRVYLAAHLFVFNVGQLWLFVRHGFLTMVVFRLVYYLHWHVLWGHARLELLF